MTTLETMSQGPARLPGVIMQPFGMFASLRAQEAGCHYMLAS